MRRGRSACLHYGIFPNQGEASRACRWTTIPRETGSLDYVGKVLASARVFGAQVGFTWPAFAASRAHWVDIGGSRIGFGSNETVEVYQEGIQFRSIKAYEAGKPLQIDQIQPYSPRHPRCGTNIVTAGTLVGLLSFLTMLPGDDRSRRQRLGLMIMLSTVALLLSQPLGRLVQERVTTDPNLPAGATAQIAV